jgi:hypothetical protein
MLATYLEGFGSCKELLYHNFESSFAHVDACKIEQGQGDTAAKYKHAHAVAHMIFKKIEPRL